MLAQLKATEAVYQITDATTWGCGNIYEGV